MGRSPTIHPRRPPCHAKDDPRRSATAHDRFFVLCRISLTSLTPLGVPTSRPIQWALIQGVVPSTYFVPCTIHNSQESHGSYSDIIPRWYHHAAVYSRARHCAGEPSEALVTRMGFGSIPDAANAHIANRILLCTKVSDDPLY
jgi:hypothetical protein